MKTLSPPKQPEENKQEASLAESPRRSIISPKVWVDTSYRARDKSIKVTAAYLRKDFKQMKIQLEELRNQQEYNSHIFSSMIFDASKRIAQAVEAVISGKLESIFQKAPCSNVYCNSLIYSLILLWFDLLIGINAS